MRVAHILWGFTAGGIETMLVDIIAEQVKHIEVGIFIINDKVDPRLLSTLDSRCKVFLFDRKQGSKSVIPLLEYNIKLWQFKPSVIHFHYTGLVRFTFCSSPKVVTIHNVHSSSTDFNRYKAIYAISGAVKDYIKDLGFEATIVMNGICVNDIQSKEATARSGKLKLVQIGRLYHPHKGQHILIEALNIVVNIKGFRNVTLDFIGEGESGTYLEKLVSSCELDNYVNFLGNRSRAFIYSHLKDYDCSIQPSVSEGFGLTIAESIAARVPVIVSNVPGTMEVICGGRHGLYFKSEDPVSLANMILDFVTEGYPIDLDAAQEYVRQNFDISRTARVYIEEYQKVLDV